MLIEREYESGPDYGISLFSLSSADVEAIYKSVVFLCRARRKNSSQRRMENLGRLSFIRYRNTLSFEFLRLGWRDAMFPIGQLSLFEWETMVRVGYPCTLKRPHSPQFFFRCSTLEALEETV